jgi:hypothetical protein
MGTWRKWNINDLVPSVDVQSLNTSSIMNFPIAGSRPSAIFGVGTMSYSGGSNSVDLLLNPDTPNWQPASFTNSSGKNLFLNGDFAVAQRGFGNFSIPTGTVGTYTADRWVCTTNANTVVANLRRVTSYTDLPFFGPSNINARNGNILSLTKTGSTSVGNSTTIGQRLESGWALAGQEVTLSFWIKNTSSATVNYNVAVVTQNTVTRTVVVANSLLAGPSDWLLAQHTFVIPSVAGVADTENDFTEIRIDFVNNTANFSLEFYQMQLELGSGRTPFALATNNPALELIACQRFFYRTPPAAVGTYFGSGLGNTTAQARILVEYPIQLRKVPTFSILSALSDFALTDSVTNVTALTAITLDAAYVSNLAALTVAKTASFTVGKHYKLTSTTANASLSFDAELYG